MPERAQKLTTPAAATILSDRREIDGIYFNDSNGSRYRRHSGYRIESYAEEGPHGAVAFYRVFRNDGVLIARVPAWQCEVQYVTT